MLCLLGLGVGVFGTLVGAGGGFILTPVLLLVYPSASAMTVTAISLVAVFFNAASGSVAYARLRRIDVRSGVVFALATLPGAIAGALVVGAVARGLFDELMGLSLAALALWLLISGAKTPQMHEHRGSERVIVDRDGHAYRYHVSLKRGAIFSVGVGFVSSFFGIGGGVVHVPLLVLALGFPTHIATATSHFVLAVMALVASITHAFAGSFHHGVGLRRAAAISVGIVIGAQVGARLSERFSGRTIQRLLAAGLLALAARVLLEGIV